MFAEGDSTPINIATCMSLIEAAILNKSDICDLSDSGDRAVWPATWNHIPWVRKT
jgi:hypothetical protein